MGTHTITLGKEYSDFVSRQSRQFNLSKFVRVSLDAYIEYVRGLKVEDGKKNV